MKEELKTLHDKEAGLTDSQWDRILKQPIEGLLYDLDLLPEEITTDSERATMHVIVEMHQRLNDRLEAEEKQPRLVARPMNEDEKCRNYECEFHDTRLEQFCGGECNGESAAASCLRWKLPEPMKQRTEVPENARPAYCKNCDAGPAACERCDHSDRMPENARELETFFRSNNHQLNEDGTYVLNWTHTSEECIDQVNSRDASIRADERKKCAEQIIAAGKAEWFRDTPTITWTRIENAMRTILTPEVSHG